ncbi:MAG: hypothetical protein HC890_11680, partial [Chloroflexaceae bacterium]|nr:hypothetical protein [Chloroflexaceae bacterium]
MPLALETGSITSELQIELTGDRLTSLTGTAELQQVSAKIPNLPRSLTQVTGKLRLEDDLIYFQGLKGYFDTIEAEATGKANRLDASFEIQAKTATISLNQAIAALKLTKPAVEIAANLQADIKATGTAQAPLLDITATTTQPARIDRLNFRSGRAQLQLRGQRLSVTEFQAMPAAGGVIAGKGEVALAAGDFRFDAVAEAIPAAILSSDRTLTSSLKPISGQGQIFGNLKRPSLQQVRALGSATFGFADGTIVARDFVLDGGRWQAQVQATQLQLGQLGPQVPTHWQAQRIDGHFAIAGMADSLQPETLKAQGVATGNLAGGTVKAAIQLEQGRWQAQTQVNSARLGDLAAPNSLTPQLARGRLEGNFAVSGTTASTTLESVAARGTAQIDIAGGTVQATDLQLAGGQWQTHLQAQGLQLTQLSDRPPVPAIVAASLNVAGTVADLSLNGLRGRGTARADWAGGSVTAQTLEFAGGKFRAIAIPRNLALGKLSGSEDLGEARLNGELAVSGDLNHLAPTAIAARGRIELPQVAVLERSLAATVAWDGSRLAIQRATGEGLEARGFIEVNPSFFSGDINGIEQIQLAVNAQGLSLKALPLLPPSLGRLDGDGTVDYQGTIQGTLREPALAGNLTLHNFRLATLTFDPLLKGEIQLNQASGASLQLLGEQDRLQAVFSANYQPESFLAHFRVDQTSARIAGQRQGEEFALAIANLPISPLKEAVLGLGIPLPERAAKTPFSGNLSGNLTFNLHSYGARGEGITITNPVFGRWQGDRFTGDFAYEQGRLTLKNGHLQRQDSEYALSGTLSHITRDPQFQGEVQITQGQIQAVLEALEIFELSDLNRGLKSAQYATAADLYSPEDRPPACNPESPCPIPPLRPGQPAAPLRSPTRLPGWTFKKTCKPSAANSPKQFPPPPWLNS